MAALIESGDLVAQRVPRQLLVNVLASPAFCAASIRGTFGTGRTHIARAIADDLTTRRHDIRWIDGLATGLDPYAPLTALSRVEAISRPKSFDQAVACIRGQSDQVPIVVVDDVEHVSEEVAEALAHLCEQQSIKLLITYRSGTALPHKLRKPFAQADVTSFELEPLDRDDVGRLCQTLIGLPADAATVDEVYRSSTGRPLLVGCLLQHALMHGSIRQSANEWHLLKPLDPVNAIGEQIRDQLEAVGHDARSLIEAVALGVEINVNAVASYWPETLAENLEEQGWLATRTLARGSISVRLAEPLLGDLIVATLGNLRRRRIVQILLQLSRLGDSGIPHENAVQLRFEAGDHDSIDDQRQATATLILAGRLDSALLLARDNWARSPTLENGAQLGRILAECSHADEAERTFDRAAKLASNDRDLVKITLPRVENLWFALHSAEAKVVCEKTAASMSDTETSAIIRAQHAGLCARDGEIRAAAALLNGLDESSTNVATVAGLARTLVSVWGGQPEGAIEPGARASEAAETFVEHPLPPRLYELILLARAEAMCFAGRVRDTRTWLEELHWCAIEFHTPFGIGMTALLHARLELERGDVDPARTWMERAFNIFNRSGLTRFCSLVNDLAILLEARHGDPLVARQRLDADDGFGELRSTHHHALDGRARAWVDLRLGDLDQVSTRLRTTAADLAEQGQRTELVGLLYDATVMGYGSSIVEYSQDLVDKLDGQLLTSRFGVIFAVQTGDVTALEHYGSILNEIGFHLDALDAYAMAAGIAQRHRDHRTARMCRARALAISCEVPSARSPALARLKTTQDRLTEREHLVARLAAEGLSSRDIAQNIGASVRTVDNLLGRVYRKLDVSGRTELTESFPN